MILRFLSSSKLIKTNLILRNIAHKPNALSLKMLNTKRSLSSIPFEKKPDHKLHNRKSRLKSEYKDNYTAALALPFSKKGLEDLKNNHDELAEKIAKNIIEHSERRVELFFYTLIAYYRSGIIPTKGHTELQHGRGRNTKDHTNVTQACHSSFFPSFADGDEKPNEHIFKRRNSESRRLSGTHFMDSLNSTVELPIFINELDSEFEETLKCREKGLEIIREVALGNLNPVEGLNAFLKMMEQAFKKIEQEHLESKKKNHHPLFHASKDSVIKAINLTKQATLGEKWCTESKSVIDAYIQLHLRLTQEEKNQCAKSPKEKEKIYRVKFEEIQHEILDTKSEFSNRVFLHKR